jgi:hypothetical protein
MSVIDSPSAITCAVSGTAQSDTIEPCLWPSGSQLSVSLEPGGNVFGVHGPATLDELHAAVKGAVDTWATVAGNISLTDTLTTPPSDGPTGVHHVRITWVGVGHLDDGFGHASLPPPCSKLSDPQITLSTVVPWTTNPHLHPLCYDLQSALTHELGHVLGIQWHHSDSVMCATLPLGFQRRDLMQPDLDFMSQSYGASGTTAPTQSTVTTGQTQPAPPTPPMAYVASIDELESKLVPGDLLVVAQRSPLSNLIKWIDDSPVDHVAVFLGNLELADFPEGLKPKGEQFPKTTWIAQAGATPIISNHRGVRKHGSTVDIVPLTDMLQAHKDYGAIGVTGDPYLVVVLRYAHQPLDGNQVAELRRRAFDQLRSAPVFSYSELTELGNLWIARTCAHLRDDGTSSTAVNHRLQILVAELWAAMRPVLEHEAARISERAPKPVGGSDPPPTMNCARFAYELLNGLQTAQGFKLELKISNQRVPPRNGLKASDPVVWITPNDLLTSETFAHPLLYVTL